MQTNSGLVPPGHVRGPLELYMYALDNSECSPQTIHTEARAWGLRQLV